jgi:multicomponent Na+:H+ antiporter subunit E
MAKARVMRRGQRLALRRLVPMQVSLLVLWVFLWGSYSGSTILTGAIVATVIPLIFYLPPIENVSRFHLGWALWFVMRLFIDITRSSFIVAGQALGIGYSDKSAVIRVPLRSRSDLILTATAEASTLIPGTVVIDVDREARDLFLHVFSVRSMADVDKARAEALAIEARAIRAIGSARDMKRLAAEERRTAKKVKP